MLDAIHELRSASTRTSIRWRHGSGWLTTADPVISLLPPGAPATGVRRGPVHQDELAREAADPVRELQSALRAGHQATPARARRVRAQDRRSVGRSDVAVPRWRQHRRRRVHALHRVRHRDLRAPGRTDGLREPRKPRARHVFGNENPRAGDHLDFLFDVFDCLDRTTTQINVDLRRVCSPPSSPATTLRPQTRSSLFDVDQCEPVRAVLPSPSRAQPVGHRHSHSQQSLYLYAVLLHLIDGTDDFPRRVRTAPEPDRCVRRRDPAPEHARAGCRRRARHRQ